MTTVPLGEVLRHRKEFFQIEDGTDYQRVRIRLHVQGVGPRDRVKGHVIKTKRQQACRPGDFIVAEIDAKVGGYGFIPDELDGAIVSSHYFLFEVDEARLLPEYLAFCIRAPWFAAQISAQGSTNYAAIRPHDVLAIQIPLPSLGEQERVAVHLRQALGDVAALRSTYAVQATDVSELRRAILEDAVRGRLTERDPDDEPAEALLKRIAAEKQRRFKAGEIRKPKALPPVGADGVPFEVPAGWAWTRLAATLIDIQTGPFGSALGKADYVDGGIPIINPTNMSDGRILPDDSKTVSDVTFARLASYSVSAGDIVVARRGEMGRCAVVTDDADGWLCGTGSLFLRLPDGLNPEYVALYVRSPWIRGVLAGESVGSTMSNLNQRIFKALPFPLPPAAEQRRIVERVDALMALCDQLDAPPRCRDGGRRTARAGCPRRGARRLNPPPYLGVKHRRHP